MASSAEQERAASSVGPKSGVGPEHQPVQEHRLVEAELLIEAGDDPIAAVEHFPRTLGIAGLVVIPEGGAAQVGQQDDRGSQHDPCLVLQRLVHAPDLHAQIW